MNAAIRPREVIGCKGGPMQCGQCNTENRISAKFCKQCGTKISVSKPMAGSVVSVDYVGLQIVRSKLERMLESIQEEIQEYKNRKAVRKILVFQGNTGTGKTTVADSFTRKLSQSGCLESEIVITNWARDIRQHLISQKMPTNEAGIKQYINQLKPGAIIIDGAVEDPEFLHELIVAVSRTEQNFISLLVGLKERFEKYFEEHREDQQLIGGYFDFPDQSINDLALILKQKLIERYFTIDSEAEALLADYVTEQRFNVNVHHKNGHLVEKVCLAAVEEQHRVNWKQNGSIPEEKKHITINDIPLKNKPRTVDEILKELDTMVGMTDVKKAVREIANKTRYAKKLAEQQGKDYRGEGNHIVITGNPGTGKTTIIRTLGSIFKASGVLASDSLLEVQGADLKAAYVGQSKDRVNDYCDQALGRILFIDEAYTLVNDQGPVDDFAKEAINVLMARLENDRDKFIGVVAGYPREMETFIRKGNPGMERRFKHRLHLPDYSADELIEIFERFNVQKEGFTLTSEAQKKAREVIREMVAGKNERFGNAGSIRVFFENTTSRLASRLAKLPDDELENAGTTVIQAEDIAWDKKEAAPIDEVLADLDRMVGMTDVKKMVRQLAENLKIQQKRIELEKEEAAARGEEYKPKAGREERNNIVITGNPGTGKTTIVRTLAKLFYSIGLTSNDRVEECQGNELKGSYVGQSKDNVNNYCERAMGGVLFVDEAYSLVNDQGPVDSFAKEAVDTLMARMENDGGKFVTVIAGYQKEIELFLDKSNPGMRRRFVHYIHLPDYSAEELIKIFEDFNVKSSGFTLSNDAQKEARKKIIGMAASRGPNFGNAGEMRELFNRIKRRQASRLNKLSEEELKDKINLIEVEDIGDSGGEEKVLSIDEVLAGLEDMVGMKEVKETVRGIATKLVHQKKIADKTGKASEGEGNNICITGNPGTGKTTIVRTLARLFKAIGLLSDDKPIEIQGADLKGSYLGQSKDKVNEYCRQAMGRVLFIDEAYSLVNEQGPVDDFSQEAITVLLAHLENDRDKYVCVVAGYPKEMDTFIKKSNPGMERRFKHYIHIPDYSAEELIEIFERFNVQKAGYTLTDAAREKAHDVIRAMVANKGPNFGNAGTLRTFFEKVTGNTANRVSKLPEDQQNAILQVIEAEDIQWS